MFPFDDPMAECVYEETWEPRCERFSASFVCRGFPGFGPGGFGVGATDENGRIPHSKT